MLLQLGEPFGASPGDRAEQASLLAHRHGQVPFLHDRSVRPRSPRRAPRTPGGGCPCRTAPAPQAVHQIRRDLRRAAAQASRCSRGRRSSGDSASSAWAVSGRAQRRHARRVHGETGGLPVAAVPLEQVGAAIERIQHVERAGMLRQEPCATPCSTDSTIAGLWNVSTSFEATMPMTPRCQPSPATTRRLCAPMSGSRSISLRAWSRMACSSCCRRSFSAVELLGQRPGFLGHGLVRERAAAARPGRACSCARRR